MKITMLGTGRAQVTECYNTCFVLSEGDRHLLVDGGGGNTILHQLKYAGFRWQDMREIFVTHKHVDHILGIVWMMRVFLQNMKEGRLDGECSIYGHEEVIRILDSMAHQVLSAKETAFIGKRLHLITVEDGEQRELMGHRVTFFDIQSRKAKQFGFMMELEDGRKLTCCGDEPCSPHGEEYARGSDLMLHEAFCLYGDRDIFHPYEKSHSTVKDACELAERLGVKNLILYHTEDSDLAHRKARYTEEGSCYYHGNLMIPDDLEEVTI